MKPIPILDAALLQQSGAERQRFVQDLLSAGAENGCFYLENHGISPALCHSVLKQAAAFFNLPETEKSGIHIRHSKHFRGYSQMKNVRDWREQLHLSWDLSPTSLTDERPDYEQLLGNNLWPEMSETPFKETITTFMEAASRLGQQLLSLIAEGLQQRSDFFEPLSSQLPYVLLKLICYYPQPKVMERSGVAPHCDWSWLTILLQDGTGGLEVLNTSGKWQEVAPRKDALFVNTGELLEIWTGGYFRAAPHRVINPSEQRKRLSVPVFINPALEAVVQPLVLGDAFRSADKRNPESAHIHRVVPAGHPVSPFVFGESEWRRKGLGQWCYSNDCLV